VAKLRELYAQGRYRQAFDYAGPFGPFRSWTGTPARLIGGRLAIQLGAPRLGRRLHALVFRASPAYPEAIYYHARYRLEKFGPLACWRFQRQHPDWSDAPPELHADWLALQGFVAARLRDFDRAERWINRAESIAPTRPWIAVERASVYDLAERYDDALTSARRALELQPWFRPGVQAAAHTLLRLGRETEACELLQEAAERIESGLILAQLATVQSDLGRHADALRSLDRYAELCPLLEKEPRRWLAARRSDLHYKLGDTASAVTFAREAADEFYLKFAERLESRREQTGDRSPSPVSCLLSPASCFLPPGPGLPPYEQLAKHWNHPLPNPPADATPPADGLPDAAERNRAEHAGWRTIEFTLTPDAAFALIERGVPFLVALVEAGFTQARLAVGGDRLRDSISFLEQGERRPTEAPLEPFLDRFKGTGPRCLALVPATEAARLDGLALPDADAYDLLFELQRSLLSHNREVAVSALDQLRLKHPGHRITKTAVFALARYDAHPVRMIAALDELLVDFPHNTTFVMAKVTALRELNRDDERLKILEAEGAALNAEPLLMQSLAQMLLPLPNRQDEANRLLRRSVRVRSTAAAGYFLLGTQWWEERQFVEAAEVYRFASALEEREDQFAEAYFRAARATEQVPEALRMFQQRAGRAAVPIPAAARALYFALLDRDEPEQAFASLEQAITKLSNGASSRPLGELLLFRAECHAGYGRTAEANEDLTAAKPLVPPAAWHKAAARIARLTPDLGAAAVHTLEYLKLEPASPEGHRSAVAILNETDGRAAARVQLGQAVQRFPHNYALLKLQAEFLSGDPDADADRVIQQMLDDCPEDAWAWRQRALLLADRKEHDAALAAVNRAAELEPGHIWFYGVAAQVHRRADRSEQAITLLHEGLKKNIDQELLLAELVQISRGRDEKREALAFIEAELRRQPHTGAALIAFVALSHQVFTEADEHLELLEKLEEFLDERPDLWQAWSVTIQQMAGLNRLEEANELAREATARFPLLAKLWLDRAQVCHAMANSEGRLDSLKEAVAVAPGWSPAARELAEAFEDAGAPEDAIAVLKRNVARSPLDPMAHGFLSEWLWEAGHSREALDRAKLALRHEPGYDWAWHAIQVWSELLEVPEEPIELARELARERPGDPRVWLRLARLLHHPRHNDEVLAALDKVVALDPRSVEAHDLRAERLAEMGRFDEALAAAKPALLLTPELPILLQGRAAWVEARRGNYAAAIPPMQALVAVDPKYVWGWHQLAEWYNETGRSQGYLEASSELVRLQPGHPVALTMRGEAKIQTGDRDGGKADLRDALKISPGYSHAAAVLFDAHLEDEEYREARQSLAVLQEHLSGPEVAVKQLQYACKTNDPDAAVEAFTEICEGPGQSPYPIQAALSEMQSAGWQERSLRVLRESWQKGGPFQPWAPIFWIDSPDGEEAEPGERLRAADAVIKAYPRFVPGHDSKAEQLALAGRFDEALAACRPADLGDPPPLELRGRAAWIEAKRGDRPKAIALMKAIVAEEPGFVHGWRQLAAWYDSGGRYRECLDAAEHFVRLEPQNPVAYVYRGEAKRSLGDHRGAQSDFGKAFEIDPSFEAAGMNLITEQLATGDIAGAARALSTLREHADGPLVRLRAVQVACRQGEREQALLHFRELAADADVARGVLREAVAAFDAEKWNPQITQELKDLAFADGANPDLAGLWAQRTASSGTLDSVADRLPELLSRNPAAGREVILAYAWAVAEAKKPVQGIIQKYNELLRAEDESWARAGGTLVAAGHYALGVAWLGNYRERDELEAWMLRPLALAYRALDQDEKALEVCRAAVKLGGPDGVLADFRVWLALDLALSGQIDDASDQIARIDSVSLQDCDRLVLALAEAAMMVPRAGPEGKAAAFAEAKEHLRVAAGSCAARDVPVGAGRAYRKAVAKIAADAGTLGANLWALWQRVAPWVK
jgi:tetratricopeptide (TPR) repeat protein